MYRKNIVGIIAAVFSLSAFSNPLLASSTQKMTKRPFRETPLYKHIIDKTEKGLADFHTKEKSSESKKQQTQEKTIQEQPQEKEDIILTDKVYQPDKVHKPTEPTPKLSYGLEKKLANNLTHDPTYRPAYGLADPSTFNPDMPFGEAIEILRNSKEPPLNIVVLWRDLNENADIDQDTPIGMDGLSGVPLGVVLKSLLRAVSAGSTGELGYAIESRIITIATKDSLPRKRLTRVYDVPDLLSRPANYGQLGLGGMMPYGGMGYGGSMGAYGRGGYGFGGGGIPYGRGRGYGGSYGGVYGSRGAYGGGYSSMPTGGIGYGGMIPYGGTYPRIWTGYTGTSLSIGGFGYGGMGYPYGRGYGFNGGSAGNR